MLEIGSGSGQHAVYFGAHLPHLQWQTSDLADSHAGILAWLADARLPNVLPPLALDVNATWPQQQYDAVFSANTLHIVSWPEVERMFAGIARVQPQNGVLAIYGRFNYGGCYTSDSNAHFDAHLAHRRATRQAAFAASRTSTRSRGHTDSDLSMISSCLPTIAHWCGGD